jgi:hypothetical protein
MTESDLIALCEKHGYVCVRTLGCYHALKLEDTENRHVKEGACSMYKVSEFVLSDLPIAPVEDLILRIQANDLPGLPFDVSQLYEILPKEKVELPEWKGWDIQDLRKIFGIDAERQEQENG